MRTDHLESEGTGIRFVSGDPHILQVLQRLSVLGMHDKTGQIGEGSKPELRNLFELTPSLLIVQNGFSESFKLELEIDAEVILLERLELRELLRSDQLFGT